MTTNASYSVPGATYDASGGYWAYPCNSQLNASFSFTGQSNPFYISNDDLNFGQVNALSDQCVGAIIEGNTSGYWILGLAFLKNYYTVSLSTAFPQGCFVYLLAGSTRSLRI